MIEISQARYRLLLEEVEHMIALSEKGMNAYDPKSKEWYTQKLVLLSELCEERKIIYTRLSLILNTLNEEYKIVRKRLNYDYRQLRKKHRSNKIHTSVSRGIHD